MLYNDLSACHIPLFIHWADTGNFAPVVEDTVEYLRGINEIYMDGLYLAIMCSEDVPYIDFDQATVDAEDTFMGTYRLEQEKRACDTWLRGTLPRDFFGLPPLEIPTLLISGELDPVNIYRFGNTLSSSLPNSLHKIVPNHAHGVNELWKDGLDAVVLQFIGQGTLEGIDLSFVDSYTRPSFISWRDFE